MEQNRKLCQVRGIDVDLVAEYMSSTLLCACWTGVLLDATTHEECFAGVGRGGMALLLYVYGMYMHVHVQKQKRWCESGVGGGGGRRRKVYGNSRCMWVTGFCEGKNGGRGWRSRNSRLQIR